MLGTGTMLRRSGTFPISCPSFTRRMRERLASRASSTCRHGTEDAGDAGHRARVLPHPVRRAAWRGAIDATDLPEDVVALVDEAFEAHLIKLPVLRSGVIA